MKSVFVIVTNYLLLNIFLKRSFCNNFVRDGINVSGSSLSKCTEGGYKTSMCSYLIAILSNWVPDNWVFQFLKRHYLGCAGSGLFGGGICLLHGVASRTR